MYFAVYQNNNIIIDHENTWNFQHHWSLVSFRISLNEAQNYGISLTKDPSRGQAELCPTRG